MLTQVTGKISYLRVHELGTGYGPSNDFLDAEAIIRLDNSNEAYGIQLRQNDNFPAHDGMFQLILAAYRNNWPVVIDVDVKPGRNNHLALRVCLNR